MKQTLILIFVLLVTSSTPVSSGRAISFAERIQYQKVIDEIFWNHTAWPATNQAPKPAFDSVLSAEEIDLKVKQYLAKSEALASYGHRLITAKEMQQEMERMANETQDPDFLREIWMSLKNDPHLIAECFVRPLLIEKNAEGLKGFENVWRDRIYFNSFSEPSNAAYRLPAIRNASAPGVFQNANSWQKTSKTGAPSARNQHVAVWTGTEMIIWGGWNSVYYNTGGRYSPVTNSWSPTSITGVPTARAGHTGVWTGTELIVWGGFDESGTINSGGRYNPATDSWVATSTNGAAAPRYYHTAVWTGTQMIVWGGGGIQSASVLKTGGRYNPATDSWTPTKKAGAPSGRSVHTAVWTGTEMIVWGGHKFLAAGGTTQFNTGGRYNPSTNSWKPTTTQNAPYKRSSHTAVWTGSEMIIWGGSSNIIITLGGRYNPNTNSWSSINTLRAPSPRFGHTAVFDGTRMIVWGGNFGNPLKSGALYHPATDTWAETRRLGAPPGRSSHSAVWTGTQMIIWGGYSTKDLKTGGRYTP